ncbi:biotin--[acetyl-CoA-carboxylase] ligase [Thauera sinica]|uniref:biotin--[biotin carboxyl-carrier protein] ligase n=1 Tax=Thauera sinica TaxID=2665146 RepID=A0ABW1AUP5_9RHOO|nr:biotin--[acetyl-CoA-carboxylase] ligase [Thauera sp. K11]
MPPTTSIDHTAELSALNAALGAHASAFAVEWIAACESSNTELLGRDLPGDERLHVLVVDRQLAGRGRRGREWQSFDGGSLTFSVQWRLPPAGTAPQGLSLVVGLAVARALEDSGVSGVQLKWPNDVLVHGRKIAGILIELVARQGRTAAAVIGIGINLRLPEGVRIPGQAAVTDLRHELGDGAPDRAGLLAAILSQLRGLLETYAAAGFGALRGAWEQRNAFADLPVRISGDAGSACGACIGVDDDGALLLHTEQGARRILSGDVSLRPMPGGQA